MTQRDKEALRERYLRWLEPQLRDEHGNPGKNYWDLTNVMFDQRFDYVIPMDENRMVDGTDLRVEFAREHRMRPFILQDLWPCSFLEVLIGLSRRLAFIAGGEPPGWAWQLLGHLELHRMYDPLTRAKQRRAYDVMAIAIERKYAPDGTGGFFPLAWPDGDQTRVELWYQMNAFASELHPEH